jgi:hypothetical protein
MKRPTESRDYVTHYFYDARLAPPSIHRSHSKTEEGARSACVVRIDAEQYNKAVIEFKPTGQFLHVYRRDPKTGATDRQDHRYMQWLGKKVAP